jgi:hypothetical protein
MDFHEICLMEFEEEINGTFRIILMKNGSNPIALTRLFKIIKLNSKIIAKKILHILKNLSRTENLYKALNIPLN